MTKTKRIERGIQRALKDVERIQSILHPLDHKDKELNLDNANDRRENAVRASVITINLAMEDMLDELFWRVFLGYRPNSKKPKRPRGKRAKELKELLDGRLSFDNKIRLARIIGLITKRQTEKLRRLKELRNKCAHKWSLDVAKGKKKSQRGLRLLEYKNKNLFDIDTLELLYHDSGPVYISMFERLLAR